MCRAHLSVALLLTALVAPSVANAQARTTGLGDQIMAVIGKNLLLESEWREQTELLADQLGLASGSIEYRKIALQTFDQLMQDLVILAAAERDTMVQLEEEQVLQAVDAEVDAVRSRFPSEEDFVRQLGESQWGSLAGYRADIQERKRRELAGQIFLDVRRDDIQPITVSDD